MYICVCNLCFLFLFFFHQQKVECNSSSESIPPSVDLPQQSGDLNSTVVLQLTDRLDRIEEKVNEV